MHRHLTKTARQLARTLGSHGIDLRHTAALNLIARALGYTTWTTTPKERNLQPWTLTTMQEFVPSLQPIVLEQYALQLSLEDWCSILEFNKQQCPDWLVVCLANIRSDSKQPTEKNQ